MIAARTVTIPMGPYDLDVAVEGDRTERRATITRAVRRRTGEVVPGFDAAGRLGAEAVTEIAIEAMTKLDAADAAEKARR